jgi:hypothetical protein
MTDLPFSGCILSNFALNSNEKLFLESMNSI